LQNYKETLKTLEIQFDFIPKILGQYRFVTEIMANEDGKVWVDSAGKLLQSDYHLAPQNLSLL
jgi:hypothetical protein